MENRILVMGLGNYLMGDEGVGVHAVQKLMNLDLPDYVDVVDGGTGGFYLLDYFSKYPVVILIDAELNENASGIIRLIRPRFASDFPPALSTHDIGLKDMVSSLQLMGNMPDIYLFAVSIEFQQMQGVELTDKLESILPDLLRRVKDLALQLDPHQQKIMQ